MCIFNSSIYLIHYVHSYNYDYSKFWKSRDKPFIKGSNAISHMHYFIYLYYDLFIVKIRIQEQFIFVNTRIDWNRGVQY